jgi:hypothetical protein
MLLFLHFTEVAVFVSHVHNIFYVSVDFKHSYHFETNQSISLHEISAEIIAEVHDRVQTFVALFEWMGFAFSFFFLLLLFKYVQKVKYNVIISKKRAWARTDTLIHSFQFIFHKCPTG